MKLDEVLTNIAKDSSGIWRIKTAEGAQVSFPNEGYDLCFEIEDNSFWFAHRNQVIQQAVQRFHNPDRPFMDIGGGNGFVAKFLEDAGLEVVLIEPGKVGAANAHGRSLSNVVCANFYDLSLKDEARFDFGLFDVIEHIEDHVGFMQKVASMCDLDSKVFFTVPAYQSLWSVRDEEAGHFRRYTRKTLSELAESAGFELIYSSYFFLPLAPAIYLGNLLGKTESSKGDEYKSVHTSNGWITKVLSIENLLMKFCALPLGGSLIGVAKLRGRP